MPPVTSAPPTPPTHHQPWDGYLVGRENTLAHAAAASLALGEAPPGVLVLHGPSGAGKSRLLQGLIAERLARRPGAAVALIAAEAFIALCDEADASIGGWAELRERFRTLELLAIDDLHGLSRSKRALAEFGPTVDAAMEAGASVVATAPGPPASWNGWPPRLLDRLRAGLALRIDGPGPESRRRFIVRRARERLLTLDGDTVEALVADSTHDGYRALEGALARLELAARVQKRPPDRATLESIGRDALPPAPELTPATIARAVASAFGVRVRDLRGDDRHHGLVVARHLAVYLTREQTPLSFAAIGRAFGHRDAQTIRHACSAAARRLGDDPALARAAETVRARLRAPAQATP